MAKTQQDRHLPPVSAVCLIKILLIPHLPATMKKPLNFVFFRAFEPIFISGFKTGIWSAY